MGLFDRNKTQTPAASDTQTDTASTPSVSGVPQATTVAPPVTDTTSSTPTANDPVSTVPVATTPAPAVSEPAAAVKTEDYTSSTTAVSGDDIGEPTTTSPLTQNQDMSGQPEGSEDVPVSTMSPATASVAADASTPPVMPEGVNDPSAAGVSVVANQGEIVDTAATSLGQAPQVSEDASEDTGGTSGGIGSGMTG